LIILGSNLAASVTAHPEHLDRQYGNVGFPQNVVTAG
jgi:hypothetical protein